MVTDMELCHDKTPVMVKPCYLPVNLIGFDDDLSLGLLFLYSLLMLNVHIGDWLWNDAITVWDSFGKLLSHTQPRHWHARNLLDV